ncbi:MAG: DNA replication/repair protein RecF [Pseudomonadota bacterium]
MTRLTQLHVERFRHFDSIDLEPGTGINLVSGPNGSGKTSLLEAIHTLSLGRSFRGSQPTELIRRGGEDLLLRAIIRETASGSREHRLALQRDRKGLALRLDGEDASRLSELARLLPVLALHPQSDDLVLGSPDHRRRFVDRIGFYARSDFFDRHRAFLRALRQRNALLKRGRRESSWDELFLRTAARLETARREVLERLVERSGELAPTLFPQAEVSLEYLPGYRREVDLATALEQGASREREMQTSLFGPHRADLRIRIDTMEARHVASRGQIKMLVALFHLAGLELMREARGEPAVILFDDLASELDRDNRRRVLDFLASSGHQAFVSVISPETLEGEDRLAAHFALADGGVRKMV